MRIIATIAGMAGIAAAPIALAGCSATPTSVPTVTQSATVTVAPSATAAPSTGATNQRGADESSSAAAPKAEKSATAAPRSKKATSSKADSEPDSVVVADAVGMSYQLAQDLWRSQGLSVMPAQDASGDNRISVLDADWYVVEQDPPAGSISEDGTVRASILKYSDN